MSQWDFCPKVQYPTADGKHQINLIVDLKATKPFGSLFVCFVLFINEANSLP